MIRICKYCGEEFEAIGTQAYCDRDHYATCVICGKQFVYDPRTLKQCCSRKCSSELRKQSIQATKKICKLCGKEFIPENNTQIYCKDIHFAPCVICGEPVQIPHDENYWLDRTCSIECTNRRRANTCMERYGVSIASQTESARDKLRERAKENERSRKYNCLLKYGVDNVAKVPEIQDKIRNTIRSDTYQARVRESTLQRYGVLHTSQLPETHRKASLTRRKYIALDGTYVDSEYEKIVYDYCLNHGIKFEYQSTVIPYEHQDKLHKTIIDFNIDGKLYECKGGHLLKGCFDYAHVPILVKLKLYAENDVTVITDSIGIEHLTNLHMDELKFVSIDDWRIAAYGICT